MAESTLNSNCSRRDVGQVISIISLSDGRSTDWDSFVESNPEATIFHTTAWRTVIGRSFPGIVGGVLVAKNCFGEIVAGVPLYERTGLFTGRRTGSPPFATFCNPLYAKDASADDFAGSVSTHFRRNKFRRAELRTEFALDVSASGPQVQVALDYVNHSIDLSKSIDEIWRQCSRTAVRRMVNNARSTGITVCKKSHQLGLSEFYQQHCASRRRLGLPQIPYRFFSNIVSVLKPDQFEFLFAKIGDQVVASVFSLKYGQYFFLEHAGDDPRFRNTGAMQLLYWTAIKRAHAAGYKIFSFGRTSASNIGLRRYKRHWATIEKPIYHYRYRPNAKDSVSSRDDTLLYQLTRATLRVLPNWCNRIIGEICYRRIA